MKLKLGLKPVTAQPHLLLSRYYTAELPSAESLSYPIGHPDLIEPHMFLNDVLGDCAEAGSIEEVRLLNATRGVTVPFTDETVVENYHEITGYVPGPELHDPDAAPNPTDQGTDIHELFAFRKKTGIVDADGGRHKITAYAGLTPGDWPELLVALSLFEVVSLGILVPDYMESQFEAGEPFDVLPDVTPSIAGQHYLPVVGALDPNYVQVFTWGQKCSMSRAFYEALSTVAIVSITEEMLRPDGKTIDGVDLSSLQEDLKALGSGASV